MALAQATYVERDCRGAAMKEGAETVFRLELISEELAGLIQECGMLSLM